MSRWQKVSNIVRKMDIYGQEIKLNLDNNIQHKTLFGGIITVFIILFTILGLYYYGNELITHTNPEIVASEEYNANPELLTISPQTYTLAFGL